MEMRRLALKVKFTRHGQILIDLLIGTLPELDHVEALSIFMGVMGLLFSTTHMNPFALE